MTKIIFENGSTIEYLESTSVIRGNRSKIKPIDCACDENIRKELIKMDYETCSKCGSCFIMPVAKRPDGIVYECKNCGNITLK